MSVLGIFKSFLHCFNESIDDYGYISGTDESIVDPLRPSQQPASISDVNCHIPVNSMKMITTMISYEELPFEQDIVNSGKITLHKVNREARDASVPCEELLKTNVTTAMIDFEEIKLPQMEVQQARENPNENYQQTNINPNGLSQRYKQADPHIPSTPPDVSQTFFNSNGKVKLMNWAAIDLNQNRPFNYCNFKPEATATILPPKRSPNNYRPKSLYDYYFLGDDLYVGI